ncbi:alpha-1,2-fucosyltransferase [Flaviaesturariibacter amylovorans]|uniref:Alpha-1,2-fucosyltransferase n=1 Tax=Flaviaesturariibacter amylovorans TaxID=1084520 RepID=A0ABP8H3M6_9BACT
MIVIQLKGGLGNQMFQYAAARALALRHGAEVLLDTAHYRADQLRNFDLLQLSAQARVATAAEAARLRPDGLLQRVAARLRPLRSRRFYKEPHFHYDPGFAQLGHEVYLQGYFQSERYFAPFADRIRAELQLREPLSPQLLELGRAMQAQESVSLHIRRGDYSNPVTLKVHGILPISYYQKAMEVMSRHLDAPRYYLFTDDPAWVLEHLDIPGAEVVSGHHTKAHFEDLFLMSQCRHQVIANSSFSWWGAWLNSNPGKKVIAPAQWFHEGPPDTQDLVPAGWTRL